MSLKHAMHVFYIYYIIGIKDRQNKPTALIKNFENCDGKYCMNNHLI